MVRNVGYRVLRRSMNCVGPVSTGLMAMGCAEDARSESEGSLAEGEPEGPARGREGEMWRFGRGTTKLVVG